MKRIAVFPGSFDPITLGHKDIVSRASLLFDEVIVAVGRNSSKNSMFSVEQRIAWIEAVFSDLENVKSDQYQGLTLDYCKEINANFMIRGLRNTLDFEYEKSIAQMSANIDQSVQTVFLMTAPEFSSINSTIVREIVKYKGDVSGFVPTTIDIYA